VSAVIEAHKDRLDANTADTAVPHKAQMVSQ
jgi:hypothetical protein